jgi:hypothetical protein
MQIGIPYIITGPDGTRAVLNDPLDPDFVGYLDPDDGIAGLDGAEVDEAADTLTDADGGVHGDFFHGRMPFTLQGFLWPEGGTPAVNARENRLKRAGKAMRADGTLTWTPDSDLQRVVYFRRQQRPFFGVGYERKFQLSLVSASHRIVSAGENSATFAADAAAGELGLASPLASPLASTIAPGGSTIVSNVGDEDSPPRFRIDGPITNPIIRNATLDAELRFITTLAAGEWLEIDVDNRQVLLNGASDRYAALQFPGSRWWQLTPGANDVRLLSTAFSAPAALTVYWRHAWS